MSQLQAQTHAMHVGLSSFEHALLIFGVLLLLYICVLLSSIRDILNNHTKGWNGLLERWDEQAERAKRRTER